MSLSNYVARSEHRFHDYDVNLNANVISKKRSTWHSLHSGVGQFCPSQIVRQAMGQGRAGTATHWDTLGLRHAGIAIHWDTLGLRHAGIETHWDCDTQGQGHTGTGTHWGCDTQGLGHTWTAIHWDILGLQHAGIETH